MLKRAFLSISGALILLVWYVSPIFKPFPKPTGPFASGTTLMEFIDQSRQERYSENLEDKRTLVVRFYYPSSAHPRLKKYSYLGNKMAYLQKYIASTYGLPNWFVTLLVGTIKTHSFIDAPLATTQQEYPLILFSHGGFGVPSDMYSVLLESLASHGYIVAAVDHPYFNSLTLYTTGKVVTDQTLSNRFNTMSPQEQKTFQALIVETFKADLTFLVDQLTKLNEDQHSIFYHRLDFNHLTAMGHSAGGTTALEFCRTSSACKSAIDLDGWYDHVIKQEPINKPSLVLFAEKSIEISEPTPEYLKRKGLTREQYFERERTIDEHRKKVCSGPSCLMAVIGGACHEDFSDKIFLKWPLREWNAANPYKTSNAITTQIIYFLKKHN